MGTAHDLRRTGIRRQSERDRLRAVGEHRLYLVDVQRRWRRPHGDRDRRAGSLAGRIALFFGDTAAQAYAIDADTGRQIWVRKVDDHPLARITGSPTFHQGRLYVPVSSYEESQGADARYACCTFRGSVVALDAATGAVVWKTYMIPEEPRARGTSTAGVTLWGPSGSGIWSAPTVDQARGALVRGDGECLQRSGPSFE